MQDYSKITDYLKEKDRRLATIIDEVGPCGLTPRRADLEYLVGVIVSQQLSRLVAAAIIERFRALFPAGNITPEAVLDRPDSDLRNIGLSGRKCDYIKELCRRIADNSLNLEELYSEDDDSIRARLTDIRGIGDWTVDIYLMFGLGRPDVFPLKDLALRKALASAYGLAPDDKTAMEQIAERWRPYRSVGSWYLFRYLDRYS